MAGFWGHDVLLEDRYHKPSGRLRPSTGPTLRGPNLGKVRIFTARCRMDKSTLEKLAEFICGDDKTIAPIYRSSSALTRFFGRIGVEAIHDGSTRKWWTLDVLMRLTEEQQFDVIKRLASPGEYGGNMDKTKLAQQSLNAILFIEGMRIGYNGIEPFLQSLKPSLSFNDDREVLNSYPCPDFFSLGIEGSTAGVLEERWHEVEKCLESEAYLAGTIMMGSLLEGLFLAVLQKRPKEANQSSAAPVQRDTRKVKKFRDWTLSDNDRCGS